MKYDPKCEIRILWVIQELGLASIEEIEERYKEHFNETADNANLIVRRWKARKALVQEDDRYKLADVPPWFKSLNRAQLLQTTKNESKEWLKELQEKFEGESPLPTSMPYGDYKLLELTFETIDPILGGNPPTEKDKPAQFPKEGDLYVVPPSWLRGFLRDNQKLMNAAALHYHVAWGKGQFAKGTKVEIYDNIPIIVNGAGVGLAKYEGIPSGSIFTAKCRFPMKNRTRTMRTIEDIQKFFEIAAETPVRGLGSNARHFGGRFKLTDLIVRD